jgi:adenosine kinase
MERYGTECRRSGFPFLYDPSQQVARLSGEDLAQGIEGAAILIVNDYEFGILSQKTGLAREELEASVPVMVVTHGAEGSTISVRDDSGPVHRHGIPAAPLEGEALDPTGVGDAYRAGLIHGIRMGAPWPVAGRIGSVAAALALEAVGPQPPRYSPAQFRIRYENSFGSLTWPA